MVPADARTALLRAVTPAALEYTIKVWQLVTHAANSPTYRRMKSRSIADQEPGLFRNSSAVEEGWRRSVHCADVLSATAMLFQCPASFTPEPDRIDPCQNTGMIQLIGIDVDGTLVGTGGASSMT